MSKIPDTLKAMVDVLRERPDAEILPLDSPAPQRLEDDSDEDYAEACARFIPSIGWVIQWVEGMYEHSHTFSISLKDLSDGASWEGASDPHLEALVASFRESFKSVTGRIGFLGLLKQLASTGSGDS